MNSQPSSTRLILTALVMAILCTIGGTLGVLIITGSLGSSLLAATWSLPLLFVVFLFDGRRRARSHTQSH